MRCSQGKTELVRKEPASRGSQSTSFLTGASEVMGLSGEAEEALDAVAHRCSFLKGAGVFWAGPTPSLPLLLLIRDGFVVAHGTG